MGGMGRLATRGAARPAAVLACLCMGMPGHAAIAIKPHLGWNLAPRLDAPSFGLAGPSRGRDVGNLYQAESLDLRPDRAARPARLHHFELRDGRHSLSFDSGRGWLRRGDASGGAASAVGQRSFGSATIGYGLGFGDEDRLRVGLSVASERRNLGIAATEFRATNSNSTAATLGWQHGANWRFEGGWFDVRSASHGDGDGPAAVLTAGVVPSERGPGVAASFAPDPSSPWHALRVDVGLRAMTLDGVGAAPLGPSARRDLRGAVTLGLRFR